MQTSQTAFITGGAKRIGREIALSLAKSGYDIALHYHGSQKEADETCQMIEGVGQKAVALRADLTDAIAVSELMSMASEALSPVTLLIHNASHFARGNLQEFSHEDWQTHLSVNTEAPLHLARDMAAQLPKETGGSHIISARWHAGLEHLPQFSVLQHQQISA